MATRAEKPTTDEIAAAVEAIGDEQLTELYEQWNELTEAQADVETALFTRITQLAPGAQGEEVDEEESAEGDEDDADGDEERDDDEDDEQDEAA